MSTNVPSPFPAALISNNNLFASINMGKNSFKLLVIQVNPSFNNFLTLKRHKKYVLLGLDSTTTISHASILRATSVLRKLLEILTSYQVPSIHYRLVATSTVRESSNMSQFINSIYEKLGLHVDVLSSSEEARLIYLGVL
ncbi:hypothetical protein Leryth_026022 [Lithospermum erythrorhizon]|nr:hypothetical protein Leryth_026022 [Lithospermum erythrorhizon]